MVAYPINIIPIQTALKRLGLGGWVFFDFRHRDPFCSSILGIDPQTHVTRRWVYLIPQSGEPTKIVHAIEQSILQALPGKTIVYRGWRELHRALTENIQGLGKVAMQYSPRNAVPTVSTVDAGTIELVRSSGVEVVSSAALVQEFEATLAPEQYSSHLEAGARIGKILESTFAEIARRIRTAGRTDEFEIQQFMLEQYRAHGLVSDHPPVVAAGANSAVPHYAPERAGAASITKGDFVLIDTWAKLGDDDAAIYFDITWTAFVGTTVPSEIRSVFEIVAAARDHAIEFVQKAQRTGRPITGAQLDDACRSYIEAKGFGRYFIHRTGHSIHRQVHGNGANIDNLEIEEQRMLIPRTLFSIEPGIYQEGKFGVRSEVDVYLTENDAVVTGRAPQSAIVLIDA